MMTYVMNQPTALQLIALRWLCARIHGARFSDVQVVRIEPGYGRDTNPGQPFAHCEDSDALVTLSYRIAPAVVKRQRINTYRWSGRVFQTPTQGRALFAFLRGRWILWAN